MKSTNASSAAFGWDFQCNAAIMLMLRNIKTASAVKVEGATEDIELMLNSGKTVFSQAKSIFNAYDDFSNVIPKLKAALKTLNNAATEPNVERLIYVTNSPNPFNSPQTIGAFSGGLTSLSYFELPDLCKEQIEKICDAEKYTFDRNLFSVYVMQFYGDGENRYKIIKDLINEFLYSVGVGDRGFGASLLKIWHEYFFTNASQHDTKFSITKQQMIWPLIVSICDIDSDDAQLVDCDEGDVDAIVHRYGAIISNNSERFEFVTKVLTGYDSFGISMRSGEKTKAFISQKWTDYASEFDVPAAEQDVLENIIKLTISNVIKRRRKIIEIKRGVNL